MVHDHLHLCFNSLWDSSGCVGQIGRAEVLFWHGRSILVGGIQVDAGSTI